MTDPSDRPGMDPTGTADDSVAADAMVAGGAGDPACWADRVCPACGLLDERAERDGRCPHCGATDGRSPR